MFREETFDGSISEIDFDRGEYTRSVWASCLKKVGDELNSWRKKVQHRFGTLTRAMRAEVLWRGNFQNLFVADELHTSAQN